MRKILMAVILALGLTSSAFASTATPTHTKFQAAPAAEGLGVSTIPSTPVVKAFYHICSIEQARRYFEGLAAIKGGMSEKEAVRTIIKGPAVVGGRSGYPLNGEHCLNQPTELFKAQPLQRLHRFVVGDGKELWAVKAVQYDMGRAYEFVIIGRAPQQN